MNIDFADIVDGTVKVLVAGLLFGAGLPLLFTLGMRLWDAGSVHEDADGTMTLGKHAALWTAYLIFAIVAAAVVVGVLYITHKSIDHYLGIELF
ncbi:hypothetical protein GCM10011492_00460 [Flexivirga endophytica]|uniref:Transmembrane protein n=1 Tax=Flexivirga endophytica TaxID=1849103 RepID=A0A916SUY7_9MICO|nr:hypothetical protein [Flexivirga endophytica]GGB14706.1 hypothetical protein GCM10011492_00460 [Flexivirga endophytica]GHB65545.1 hypothetical protein GCM10008112_38040 [Flexivirga endophytica]